MVASAVVGLQGSHAIMLLHLSGRIVHVRRGLHFLSCHAVSIFYCSQHSTIMYWCVLIMWPAQDIFVFHTYVHSSTCLDMYGGKMMGIFGDEC